MATATMTETEKDTRTLVEYRKEGNIAVFLLSDPPANTYTHEMMRQLDECIIKARFDNDIQVIIIRGAGENVHQHAGIFVLPRVDAREEVAGERQRLVRQDLHLGHVRGKELEVILDEPLELPNGVGDPFEAFVKAGDYRGEVPVLDQEEELFLALHVVVEPRE